MLPAQNTQAISKCNFISHHWRNWRWAAGRAAPPGKLQ